MHKVWLSGMTRLQLVHFDHVGFLSRNLRGVGESRWRKMVCPFSPQMRQLEEEEEDLPLPDKKGCEVKLEREPGGLNFVYFVSLRLAACGSFGPELEDEATKAWNSKWSLYSDLAIEKAAL